MVSGLEKKPTGRWRSLPLSMKNPERLCGKKNSNYSHQTNSEVAAFSDILILAVKPQFYAGHP